MKHSLIDLNGDLKKLRDEGLEIEVLGAYLLVHHVPYCNSKSEICFGTLVSELTLASSTEIGPPASHTIHFAGSFPSEIDGKEITGIKHSHSTLQLDGLTVQYLFSNKPAGGYPDYYKKFKRYIEIISAPAKALDPAVTESTFRVIADTDYETVFRYLDTNSSRAEVVHITKKFLGLRVAIIGLGGTGAYILDQLAKTPVEQIHLFDGKDFFQHTAFRSPGAASTEKLERRLKKVDYYFEVYNNMHKGLAAHPYYFTLDNMHELNLMSFVFVAIDDSAARKIIIDYLVSKNIPFIDVGMGVKILDDSLIGMLRMTASTEGNSEHLSERVPMSIDENNDYNANIQIADLNMLNAALAIVKWKKLIGFYQDLEQEFNCTYSINTAQLTNDDIKEPVC